MPEPHYAHMLQSWNNKYCGDTNPPTILIVDYKAGSLTAEVYPDDFNPHIGQVAKPDRIEQFLIPANTKLSLPQIGWFALRAIGE